MSWGQNFEIYLLHKDDDANYIGTSVAPTYPGDKDHQKKLIQQLNQLEAFLQEARKRITENGADTYTFTTNS